MKNKPLLILNLITIIGMIFYAVGIYLETEILKRTWGNSAVNFSIQIFGPLIGLIIVTLIEIGILTLTFLLSKFKDITVATNVYMCWFWIFSLYQCAINSILSFVNLPNEPINLFFKILWPNFWYPMKELIFIIISIILTWIWMKKIEKINSLKLDIFIIVLLSIGLWLTVAVSQMTLINTGTNIYY